MINRIKRIGVWVVFCLSLLAGQVAAGVTKHALLIGISDYTAAGLSSLPGSVNDVRATHRVLRESLEFKTDNIVLLLDREATHGRIVSAFKQLDSRVREGDFVYIHYSGHGSYVPDLNGDEKRGLDQTWVSYGARANKGTDASDIDNFDILDDEISHWLAPIYAKAGQVVFVSDSCHSGTVSRGGEAPVQRAAPNDNRMHPLGSNAFRQADFTRGVQIGSTEDTQPAFEIKKAGESYGLFTWHWLNSLKQATPEQTWNDLFIVTDARIKANARVRQRPQISGRPHVTVLGGEFQPSTSALVVTAVKGNRVVLGAGSLSGITPGSLLVKKGSDSATGSVRVKGVKPFSATGTLTGSLQKGDLLVVKERFYAKPVMGVFVAGEPLTAEDHAAVMRISKVVDTVPGLARVRSQAEADLVLYFIRRSRGATGRLHTAAESANLQRSLPESEVTGRPEVWVLDQAERLYEERLTISMVNAGNGVSLLTENLKRIRNIHALKSLGSAGGGKAKVALEVVQLQQDSSCGSAADDSCLDIGPDPYRVNPAVDAASFDGRRLHRGDILTFNITNQSNRAQYVYLLDIMPNGRIQTIYPTPELTAEEHRLNKGERRDLSEYVGLMADTAGSETIKMIAATQPVNIQLLEQSEFAANTRGAGLNPLEQLLKNNLAEGHSQARGVPIAMGGMQWTTGQMEFNVLEPAPVSKRQLKMIKRGSGGEGGGAAKKMKARGPAGAGEEKFVRVRVFFGVNRDYHADAPLVGERFGNDRGELRLGSLWVSIPPNHEPGKLESPSLLSLRGENAEQHVMLQSLQLMDEERFTAAVKRAAEGVPEQRMLLYIHGYNNSFEQAAKRTAQIAYDLNREGVNYLPLLFSWPSGNSVSPTQYTRAWTNKEWAIPDLVRFVELAVDRTGITNVHLLAHSMGTNLFSSASLQLAYATPSPAKRFGEVILAAPDIDAATFYRLLLPGIEQVAGRTTVYTASQDVALYVSKVVHSGYSRLGDSSDRVHALGGADVVDASEVNTSDIGHAYYAAIKRLLDDIAKTISGVDIEQRELLAIAADKGQAGYWKFSD